MVYRKSKLEIQLGSGRSFIHDAQHGIFKILPAITAMGDLIKKIAQTDTPATWIKKATDYLQQNEASRQYIQEDLDVAKPEDFTWQELLAYEQGGYKLPLALTQKISREINGDAKKVRDAGIEKAWTDELARQKTLGLKFGRDANGNPAWVQDGSKPSKFTPQQKAALRQVMSIEQLKKQYPDEDWS